MIGYLVIAFFQVPTHTFPGCCNGLDSWDVGLRKQWRESMSALYVKMLGDKTHVMFHHPFFYPFPILCSILFATLFLSPSLSFFLSFSLYILFHILQHNPPFPDTPIYSYFFILMPISLRDFPARHDSLPESLHLPNSWLVISCYIPFISH